MATVNTSETGDYVNDPAHRTMAYIFNEIDGKLPTLFIKTKSILSNGAPNWINGVNTENGNGSVYHDEKTIYQYLCILSPIQ